MKKKNFKDLKPIMRFITPELIPDQEGAEVNRKKNRESAAVINNSETKSKRLNLLIKPSVLGDIKKIAVMQQVSVNDLINKLLNQYRIEHNKDIQSFNNAFNK